MEVLSRFDKLKQADITEMKDILCQYISVQTEDACAKCPFDDRCYHGHNGILDWLTEDYGEVVDKWALRPKEAEQDG